MKHYAGINLSMETSHVCIVDAEGRKVAAQCVDSTPEAIVALLERHGPMERVVIETGRMTPWVARGLHALGVAIVCVDARQAHQSLKAMKAMKANKTDPHDAAGLAQLARTGFYKEVHVKSPTSHGVRSVTPPARTWSKRVSGSTTPSVGSAPPSGSGRGLARASGSSRGCKPPSLSRVSARRWPRCSRRGSAWLMRSAKWTANSRRSASRLRLARRS